MLKDLITTLVPRIMGTYGKQRLSTLIYHRVLPAKDSMRPYEVTADQFEWQMRLISKYFSPVSIDEGLTCLEDGTLPERAVCVTFDDGYADNLTVAQPILEKYNIPATVFISTGYLNKGRMWNDSVLEVFRRLKGERVDLTSFGLNNYALKTDDECYQAALHVITNIKHRDFSERQYIVDHMTSLVESLPEDLMLTDQKVVELLGRGVGIGAHTVNHPILENLDEEVSYKEIADSRDYLNKLLGVDISYFAYPNGQPDTDFSRYHADVVKELGFKAAFTTQWGVATKNTNLWYLPRFTPWDNKPYMFLIRLLLNCRVKR